MTTRTQQTALARVVGANGVHFAFGRSDEFKASVVFWPMIIRLADELARPHRRHAAEQRPVRKGHHLLPSKRVRRQPASSVVSIGSSDRPTSRLFGDARESILDPGAQVTVA